VVLARGDTVIPIPGTTRIERLEENAAAVNISLTPAEVDSLDALVSTSKELVMR